MVGQQVHQLGECQGVAEVQGDGEGGPQDPPLTGGEDRRALTGGRDAACGESLDHLLGLMVLPHQHGDIGGPHPGLGQQLHDAVGHRSGVLGERLFAGVLGDPRLQTTHGMPVCGAPQDRLRRGSERHALWRHVREDAREDRVDQVQHRLLGAPGVAEVPDVPAAQLGGACLEQFQHLEHEGRVGIAEAVDGLLGVPHPDLVLDQPAQLEEQLELDGGGVLELVDRQQAEAIPDGLLSPWTAADQLEGANLLIDEVDQPQIVLVLRVRVEGPGGRVHHQVDQLPRIGLQHRIGQQLVGDLLGDSQQRSIHGLGVRETRELPACLFGGGPGLGHLRGLRELRPSRPGGARGIGQVTAQLLEGVEMLADGRCSAPGGGIGLGTKGLQSTVQPGQPGLPAILIGGGRQCCVPVLLPRGRGRGAQLVRSDAIGAGPAGEVSHVGAPGRGGAVGEGRVLLAVVAGARQQVARTGTRGRSSVVDGGVERGLLPIGVQHLHVRGDPGVHGELAQQLPGHRVDGADHGAVDPGGGLGVAHLQQGAPHPVGELGGGLGGEGSGDQLGGLQAALDPLGDVVGEGVGLAGAGGGVDQGEGHRKSPVMPHSWAYSLVAQ